MEPKSLNKKPRTKPHPTPTAHGDWRVVNGVLTDASKTAPAENKRNRKSVVPESAESSPADPGVAGTATAQE